MNSERPTNGNDQLPHDNGRDEMENRAALEPLASTLRGAAVWAQPPAGLDSMIVADIRAASAPLGAMPPSRRLAAGGRRRLLVAAAAVAAAAVAFTAGFLFADRNDDDAQPVADVALAGSALVPAASATGVVVDRGAGYAIRLQMAGLPPAPDGSYYEGFLRADDGELVSVGTFHMRGGDGAIVLWSGVGIADYGTLVVTEVVERSAGEATGPVVLEGPLQRR